MTAQLSAMPSSSRCVRTSLFIFYWSLTKSLIVLDPNEKAAYLESHWSTELQIDALDLARKIVSICRYLSFY